MTYLHPPVSFMNYILVWGISTSSSSSLLDPCLYRTLGVARRVTTTSGGRESPINSMRTDAGNLGSGLGLFRQALLVLITILINHIDQAIAYRKPPQPPMICSASRRGVRGENLDHDILPWAKVHQLFCLFL